MTLGILAIMKNEAMNVTEWLDHYFWAGAEHIFLIDNGSDDGSVDLVNAHPMRDRIDLMVRPEPHKQGYHYREAYDLLEIASRVEWLMMADLDEFWFHKSDGDIKIALPLYAHVDLVYTNWTVFGSSGLDRHPQSIRRAFLKARPKLAAHENSKWLCRTSVLKAEQIYTHKIRDIDSRRVISDNIELQINHYIIQSREYFERVKMTRGDASRAENDGARNWDYFNRQDAACTATDTVLMDLLGAT